GEAVRGLLASLLDEYAKDWSFAFRRRRIVTSPSVGAEARLERDRDPIGLRPQFFVGAWICEDSVALHEARAVDEEGQRHGLAEHHHGVVAGDGVRIARGAGDKLPLVVIAKPDLAQTRGLRTTALEALETADGKPRRAAIGPAR